jgi:hypothetical protein
MNSSGTNQMPTLGAPGTEIYNVFSMTCDMIERVGLFMIRVEFPGRMTKIGSYQSFPFPKIKFNKSLTFY